jgi:lipid-binding SYLF domain-containing protein
MKVSSILLAALAVSALPLVGCESTPETPAEQQAMRSDARAALLKMYDRDPSLRSVVENAYGYAIFPNVGKGGLIAGGAHGTGEVFEQGRLVGYATLTQATIGAQIGGQSYDELIVFQDEPTFRKFQSNQYSPAANATAVALKSGTGAGTSFENGTATFILPTSGLMAEASIGGQSYTYQSLGSVEYRR